MNSTDVSPAINGEKLEDEDEEAVSQKEDGITLVEKMHLWSTKTPAEEEDVDTVSQKEDGIPLAEKINNWNTEKLDLGPQGDDIALDQNDAVNDEEDGEDYAITHFPEAWQFLTGSHAYYWLLSRVRSEILHSKREDTTAENIRRNIVKGLSSRPRRSGYGQAVSKARFEISWSLPGFLEKQYPEERNLRLGSLITLVASGDDVQALTCAQYMSQVWPVTGPETLSALQGALDKGLGQAYKGKSNIRFVLQTMLTDLYVAIMMDKTRITLEINDSAVFAVIKGTEPAIAETGQQLAWLGAALRSSPSDRMAYSTPLVALSATTETTTFTLDFQVTQLVHHGPQRNGSCWRSLFRNPIMVEGYPISARVNGEKGLEIPLNMMAGLGQASRATTFDGGLVIKGHSAMFCPTQRIKNSVLWHYLFNHDGSRMSYLAPNSLLGGRASIHEVDTTCLEYSRNFLGWTSHAEIYAGEFKGAFTLDASQSLPIARRL